MYIIYIYIIHWRASVFDTSCSRAAASWPRSSAMSFLSRSSFLRAASCGVMIYI